jgi:hypothetical protein
MDLDALLHHYFGTNDPDSIPLDAMAEGRHRLEIDFGTEREPSRKFALWTLMEAFGFAPEPEKAFKDPAMQAAARRYLDAAWDAQREE